MKSIEKIKEELIKSIMNNKYRDDDNGRDSNIVYLESLDFNALRALYEEDATDEELDELEDDLIQNDYDYFDDGMFRE